MANSKISDLTNYTTPDATNDVLPIWDNANSQTKKITRNNYLGISGSPVGTSDSQALSNKTIGNTNTITVKDSTSFILQNNADTSKQAKFDASGITTATTRTYALPDANTTLVGIGTTQTLTNKTMTAPVISGGSIDNTTVTVDAITGHTTSNTGSIYSVTITAGAVSMPGNLAVTGNTTLTGTLSTTGQPTFQSATAPPAAGASTAGIKLSSTANLGIYFGSGAPTFSAAQGSIYIRTDGSSTSTRLYVNSNGTTGWTNFTSAT